MTVIDDYFKKVDNAHKTDLERIRTIAKLVVPEAKEVISYNMPTLMYHGKPFLGFDIHKHHIGIYPFSGQVIENMKDQFGGLKCSKGAIQVPFEHPISETLLKKIITCRLKQIDSQL